MSQIENVSGTAFVVAEYRAEENRETAPLYRDSVVELFLNDGQSGRRGAAGGPLSAGQGHGQDSNQILR